MSLSRQRRQTHFDQENPMKRTVLLALALTLLVPGLAWTKTFTVSVTQIVEHPALDSMRNAFIEELKAQSVEATFNVHIAQGNPATNTQIASQIAGEKADLILAITTPSAQAVVQKIKDVPIVFTGVTDPVGAGLVKSLEAPGGNVTGMTDMIPVDRQIGLIRQFQPNLK
jgi:putative ABC transport system substrate-binding protein